MIFRVVRIKTRQLEKLKMGREGWVRAAANETLLTGSLRVFMCLVSTRSF
jgi:hypothetical protein